MLEPSERQLLLKMARDAITAAVNKREYVLPKDLPGNLLQSGASFVTLTKNGELRGCVGTLSAHQPLYLDTVENARHAAFDDGRFDEVSKEDLGNIHIEVSVLSIPLPRHLRSTYDVLDMLRREKPGLILRYGYHQATFLPQVWEQISGAEEFLSRLCMKAGLASRAWEDKETAKKIHYDTYIVQKFEE
jgi:AmmeMemoRadiSam system protein A